MDVYEGSSRKCAAADAVREATSGWPTAAAIGMIFVFHSTAQDAAEVAAELAVRFPRARVAGCTTAGEHISGRHDTGTLALVGVASGRIRWAVAVVGELDRFDVAAAEATRDKLLASLGRSQDDLDPSKHFCLTLLDGLSMREEVVLSCMAEALFGVPLLGGSAGDDQRFQRTRVLAEGAAHDRSAVFVLAECDDGFTVFKHQHFARTKRLLAVTKVDPEQRRVIELDGFPAAFAYARALGIARSELTAEIMFENPLALQCNGELYVRSAMRIEPDDSISFYCGLEEGMVLNVVDHVPIEQALEVALGRPAPRAKLLLAFNCILRALEARAAGKHEELATMLHRRSEHVLGFDTYGEALDGLHINQTLVGIALGVAS
jgi:hypothetical protein